MTTKKPKPADPASTSMFAIPITYEQAEQQIQQFVSQELAKWTEDKLRAHITTTIENKIEFIVSTALGFESRYNRWEVDHCNGRAGESVVGQMIAQLAIDTVQKAVQKAIAEGKFTLTKAHIKALSDDFEGHVRGYNARKLVAEIAEEKLKQLRDLLRGKITGAKT